MIVDRTSTVQMSWEDVLTAVEKDVEQTASMLRQSAQVSPDVQSHPAPATVLLPAVEPMVPPLETMPPVPAELAARVAAGPAFWTEWLDELDRGGLLEELPGRDAIGRALAEAPGSGRYESALNAKRPTSAPPSRRSSTRRGRPPATSTT